MRAEMSYYLSFSLCIWLENLNFKDKTQTLILRVSMKYIHTLSVGTFIFC